MTIVLLVVLSSVGSFAMGVWQGWILRRPPPPARPKPLLRVPRFERASLIISEGCIVELGAVEIGASGTFDISVEPRVREASVIIGDA